MPVSAASVAVIALFCSLLAFQTAAAESVQVAELDRQRADLALVEARHSIRLSASAAVTERLLDEVGESAIRLRGIDDAQMEATLEQLVAGGGSVGADAERIAQALAAVGGEEQLGTAAVEDLLDLADTARRSGRSTSGVVEIDELRAAFDVVMAPDVLQHGVLAASLTSVDAEPASTVEAGLLQLIDAAVAVWIGSDVADTVDGQPLRTELDAMLVESGLDDVVERLDALIADEASAPDVDAAELVTRTGEVVGVLTARWTAAADDIDAGLDVASRTADARLVRFRIAGVALAALAAALLLAGLLTVVWHLRRERVHAQRTDVESFTGLPTGASLHRRTAPLFGDSRFDEHLVGVVRIAELPMVVDGYGNAAAARVEVVVARRLRASISWLTSNRSEAAAVLVRMRAGVYALTIHAAHGIDVDLVRRVLTLQSGSPIRLGQDHLPIRYGVGFSHGCDALDLDVALEVAERNVDDEARAPNPPRVLIGGPLDLTRGH